MLADRLNRRGLVDHPFVVQQQGAPGLLQREAHAVRAVGLEHTRLATLQADTRDQQHGDKVNPVAVRALGRRSADAVGRVDTELMRLDVPRLRAFDPGRERRERDEVKPHRYCPAAAFAACRSASLRKVMTATLRARK